MEDNLNDGGADGDAEFYDWDTNSPSRKTKDKITTNFSNDEIE